MTNDNSCISLTNVNFGYSPETLIFENLNLNLAKGAYVGINGNNGSGKSTFLKLILGLVTPLSGSVRSKIKYAAYVPQNSNFDRTFPIDIGDMLKMARLVNREANVSTDKLKDALNQVGLKKPLDCSIQALSGGQFQRVIFARMLLMDPQLLILDEAFNGIDEQTIEDLAEVLKSLHKREKTILLAVHDSYFLEKHVPRVIEIRDGKLTGNGAPI